MSLRSNLFLKSTSVTAVCLIVLGALSAASREFRSPQPTNASTVAIGISPIAQEQSNDSEVQGLVIAIRPNGFSPAEIEITDGRYVLVVQNRSGLRDLTFQFDRQGGERLHQVRAQRSKWSKQFDLHPGTYALSVIDHPDWRCLIKVTPR